MWSAHAAVSPLSVDLAGTHWAEAMEGSHPVVELNDGDTATLSEDVYSINFAPGQLQPQSSSAACSRASTLRCSWSTLPASSAQPCWGQRGTFKRQFLKETKNRPQERNSQVIVTRHYKIFHLQ
eukprot:11748-Heterococcus_DN1.PRE.1